MVLALDLDGFWTSEDESRGRKEDVVLSAAKWSDVSTVDEARIIRGDWQAVVDVAGVNHLPALAPLVHEGSATRDRTEATRAHDHAHYAWA